MASNVEVTDSLMITRTKMKKVMKI